MDKLIGQIGKAKTREQAMIHIMMFVPCIMHCENCVGIKFLTMLFIEGLSNFQGAKFPHLADVRGEKEEKMFVKDVEKQMRGEILGSYGNEAQWSMPLEKQTSSGEGNRKIGTINMENYKVRKCMEKID